MNTRFCVIALTVLLAVASGSAQVAPVPPSPQAAAAGTPDYSQEAFVIEQLRTSYRFDNDGTGRREQYARIKVQSDAGVQQWGQLVFGYNAVTERIDIQYVRVHKAGGVTITAPADAVQDLSSPIEREAPIYTDFRQKHITVPSLRPGETLEFNIVVSMHTALASGHFWMQHDFRTPAVVLDDRLEVDVPATRALTLKTATGFSPVSTDAAGRRVYRWASSQKTPSAQHAKDLAEEDEELPAAIRLTTFQSWAEIGQWYAGIEQRPRTPTPELRAKAEELTAGKKTSLEKVEALYDFVAPNFRYVSLSLGAGRYQPRAAADVLRDQYGDCKDKHTLLASLMESIGLRADTVLINSTDKLDPEFPSPSAFDHVITRADIDGQQVWLDVTTEVAPFRLLSPSLRKKQALVVSRPAPHLEETPADPPMLNTHLITVTGEVSESGALTGRVVHAFRGDAELLLRPLFRQIPTARWKDFLTEFEDASGLAGEIGEYTVSDPTATRQPFTIEYAVTKAGFADRTRRTASLVLPHAEMDLPESPEADEDVELGSPARVQYRLRLEFADGFGIRAPQSVTVSRDYGEYRASYDLNGRTFTAERTLETRVRELPAARSSDFAAFRRVVSADDAQRLALEIRGTLAAPSLAAGAGARGAGANASASELVQRGLEMVLAANAKEGLTLLQRASELEPRHRTVWLALGTAYFSLKNFDAAVGAFQKQIELDPFHDRAYMALGTAYKLQRRYAEAEAAFKKQSEVNPLDPAPQHELVTLYFETERYSDAIPLLERAAGVAGAQADAHVSLGKAYLNVGRTDDAVVSFDKAIELSPTPMIWNNVAYHLSEKSQRLDRAQQYAESAVTSVSVESRNISLARVTSRDVAVMGTLASYWDTLAWVAFMKGDLARAEQLLTAAWRLSESPVIGDHLAQTYEKQGRRDQAIRTYAAVAGLGFNMDSATRDRLRNLVRTDAEVKRLEDLHRSDPATMRTVSVKSAGGTGTAVFNILLGPNGVEDVAFSSGDEALRGHAAAVRGANFKDLLPINDAVPAKLLRQGALACSPNRSNRTDCVLVLFTLSGMRAPAQK